MNAIVRKHYPVERLPKDLREGLPPYGWVRIEIIPEPGAPNAKPLSQLIGSGQNVHGNEDAVLSYIRSLREDV